MAHPEIASEIEKIRAYIDETKSILNALEIYPRTVQYYPFDAVASELISKAFALSSACISLIPLFPEEAFGLSRSLVECSVTLRYLTARPEEQWKRARRFLDYQHAMACFWFAQTFAKAQGTEEKERKRRHGEELGLTPDDKLVRKHWSGEDQFVWNSAVDIQHPLDDASLLREHKRDMYSLDYRQTSNYVHCSQPGIENYFPALGAAFRVGNSTGEYYQPGPRVLLTIVVYLYLSIVYALFGLGVAIPQELGKIQQDARETVEAVVRKSAQPETS